MGNKYFLKVINILSPKYNLFPKLAKYKNV